MPKLGESIIEATITRWVKSVGDQLEEDDSIVEIATDKVDSEIPSPVEGKLVETLYNEGDVVAVGEVIAIVELDGEDSASDTARSETTREEKSETVAKQENIKQEVEEKQTEQSKQESKPNDFSSSKRFYSPLVKSIAKKENISVSDLDGITGSGKDGRVTKVDVLEFLKTQGTSAGKTSAPKLELPMQVTRWLKWTVCVNSLLIIWLCQNRCLLMLLPL